MVFCIGFTDCMLPDKKLTDFTSLFSPYDFEKNDNIILSYFKEFWVLSNMNECNSIKIDKTNLTDQTKYRLNEITK